MVSLLVLAACQHSSGPAPIYDGGSGEPRPLGPASAVPVSQAGILETAGGRVTVQPGETLYAISRRSGVPVRSLIDANNLQPPYRVQAGQVLILPSTRQHIVQQGETLYAVARRYNVEAASLARMNHIDPPYTIKLGQPLLLPPSVAEGSQVAAAPPTSALSPPGVVPALPPASVPTAATAPAAGVTTTALPPPTPTGPPQALAPQASPPQTLPPPATAPAPPPVPPRPPAQPTPPAPESADEAPPPAGTAVSPPEPESGVPPPAVPPGPKAAPSAAVAALVEGHRAPVAPLFSWPVSGQIVSTFGPAAGGTHNDGINVSAPEGTTVVAAEAGTIAYAGNELRGFGNLLLIKHDGGWVTAYAHNQVLLVKKGDRVRRGQAIARVGSTGGVSGPQLHFELRNGTKAVDPLDHLPQLTAGD
jgi:murein DD-endopeptidase MepM/ murein hydrolase activator NlpD